MYQNFGPTFAFILTAFVIKNTGCQNSSEVYVSVEWLKSCFSSCVVPGLAIIIIRSSVLCFISISLLWLLIYIRKNIVLMMTIVVKNLKNLETFEKKFNKIWKCFYLTSLFVFSFHIDIISSYIWFIAGEVLALSKLYLSSLSSIHNSFPVIKPVNSNTNNITQVRCNGFHVYFRAFDRRHTIHVDDYLTKIELQRFGQIAKQVFGSVLFKPSTSTWPHEKTFMLSKHVPLSPLNKLQWCTLMIISELPSHNSWEHNSWLFLKITNFTENVTVLQIRVTYLFWRKRQLC